MVSKKIISVVKNAFGIPNLEVRKYKYKNAILTENFKQDSKFKRSTWSIKVDNEPIGYGLFNSDVDAIKFVEKRLN